MMKRMTAILLLVMATTLCAIAQRPFEGHFFCKETGVNLYLNLYEETLEAPGFSFLGKMNGTWMVIKSNIKSDNKAIVRFSNDIGSDSQDIELTLNADSTYTYRAVGGNAIRRAVGRKLVKVAGEMTFKRIK